MELIKKYFPNLSIQQLNQLKSLKDLYKYWNSLINVISRKTFEKSDSIFYRDHILFCLSISKIFDFSSNQRIMDLGTGGGLPGIPLAIIFPYTEFFLVDSIRKKIKVVEEIVSSIQLHNVQTICKRAERLNKKFDFIVNRGVAQIKIIHQWTKNKFKKKSNNKNKSGTLYLKGGDLSQEIKLFPYAIEYSLNQYFDEPFFFKKKIIWIPNT